mmetsp:Transcript_33275/g.74460  ORF Transcript_33275/g.74460 Transcript_33275/m.74460 type:complete len:245 (+) Transcript_33275:528-1262(+)
MQFSLMCSSIRKPTSFWHLFIASSIATCSTPRRGASSASTGLSFFRISSYKLPPSSRVWVGTRFRPKYRSAMDLCFIWSVLLSGLAPGMLYKIHLLNSLIWAHIVCFEAVAFTSWKLSSRIAINIFSKTTNKAMIKSQNQKVAMISPRRSNRETPNSPSAINSHSNSPIIALKDVPIENSKSMKGRMRSPKSTQAVVTNPKKTTRKTMKKWTRSSNASPMVREMIDNLGNDLKEAKKRSRTVPA